MNLGSECLQTLGALIEAMHESTLRRLHPKMCWIWRTITQHFGPYTMNFRSYVRSWPIYRCRETRQGAISIAKFACPGSTFSRVRDGVKPAIAATAALLICDWFNPPGAVGIPLGALALTYDNKNFIGGKADRGSLQSATCT